MQLNNKTSRLMFMETTAVRCETGTKHTNTVSFKDKTATGFPARSRDFLFYPKALDVLWEPPSIQCRARFWGWRNFQTVHVGLERVSTAANPVVFVVVLSASVNTVDLVTVKLQANTHPPLATSTHPVGPSTSTNNSTGQKPCTAICRDGVFRR
jgi:hypothetical protein